MGTSTENRFIAAGGRGHWEAVYAQRDADQLSWFQRDPGVSLQLIDACALEPDAPLIDVGGGASVLVDHLLDLGYRDLTVLDLSGAALACSRTRLGGRASLVHWMEADLLEFRPTRQYALWHDRALFHFMTEPDQRRRYVRALDRSLQPGGRAIIATFSRSGPRRCSGLDIVQYDAPALLAQLGTGFELQQQVDEAHRTPAGAVQNFSYFLLRRT